MGGLSIGSAAARLGVGAFLDHVTATTNLKRDPELLQRALEAANQAVLAFAHKNNSERQVACTLVAAWLFDGGFHWISVGDSRAYLVRNGRMYRLTVDHTYAEDRRLASGQPVEAEAGQPTDPEAVTAFVGYPGKPRADASVRPMALAAGDCVVLASDGLYKVLPESDTPSYLSDDLRKGCQAMVDRVIAHRLPEQDNVTVLAMRPSQATEGRRILRWPLSRK
jgi:protein phosphatase